MSVINFIKCSKKHQQAIYDVFEKSWIVSSVTPESLGDLTAIAFGSPSIVFTDKDLLETKYRDLLLHMTVEINNKIVKGALIDTGAGMNIMLVHTMRNIEILESSLIPFNMPIFVYDQSRRSILGKIHLNVTLGPAIVLTEFCVLSVVANCDLILGRPWLNAMKAVSLTRHQCLKFQHGSSTIKAFRDLPTRSDDLNAVRIPNPEDVLGRHKFADPPTPKPTPSLLISIRAGDWPNLPGGWTSSR